jgi:ribosomal protein S18 acetylase RimI-like enzyme
LLAEGASERIKQAITHFALAGRPFSWWLGPGDSPPHLGELLLDAGLARAESELAMAAKLTNLPAVALPPGLTVCRVHSDAELAAFALTITDDAEALRYYLLAAPILLQPNAPQWFYLGYLDGQAVASAELTVGGGVAGLYNITTRAECRGRGIGSAMTLQPLHDARAVGLGAAVLQAADAGVNVYRRIGFAPFGVITEYKPLTKRIYSSDSL